ncbi:MAG: branched-chain amino acid ABC transporter substrate-binding protein [Bauldia sp.]|nr:branched-chain amino acid ABC transporter substrate-binding protein [Bauldia sp.]
MRRAAAILALSAAASLAAVPARAEVTIAIAAPLSGPLAPLGAEIRAGVEAAVSELNLAGGVLGEIVMLDIEDDRCNVETAQGAASRIQAAGAVLVVGHLCSRPAIAAAQIYAASEIILIAPGAPDPAFTENRPSPGVFRLFPREDGQPAAIADYLAATYGDIPLAVFDDDTAYGSKLADAVRAELTALGIEPALVDTFSSANPRTEELLERISFRNVGAVFVAADPADLAAFAAALSESRLGAALVAGDTAADPGFVEAAGAAADGTVFAYLRNPAGPDAARAIAAIEAGGGAASLAALYAFAAVEVWAGAVEAVGAFDFGAVSAAIAANSFDTVVGAVGFTANGDMTLPGWAMHQWVAGRMVRAE